MKPKRSDKMNRSITPIEKTRPSRGECTTASKLKPSEIEGNNDSFSTVNVSSEDKLLDT